MSKRSNRARILQWLTVVASVAIAMVAMISAYLFWRDSFVRKSEPSAAGVGVVFYDRWRTAPGYNLIMIYPATKRFFCEIHDLEGKFVMELAGQFCLVLSEGGFVTSDNGLSRFDSDHQLEWRQPNVEVHHDIAENISTGEIYAWERDPNVKAKEFTIRGDMLAGYSKEGKPTFRWRVVDHIEDLENLYGEEISPFVADDGSIEISHFNGVQVLPANRWEEKNPAFRRGNLLVSCARCACMAIIDRQTGKFVWRYYTNSKPPHHLHTARMTESGSIVYFHNLGDDASAAVIEINPLTSESVWEYRASSPQVFSSPWMGSSERLPNGNTLITQMAHGGGAFEVTPDKRVVWEWRNSVEKPVFAGQIYKVIRVPASSVKRLLESKVE